MKTFVSRTLSVFVALVMFAVLVSGVLYYTTPPWLRAMTSGAMRTMEQLYGPPPTTLQAAREHADRARAWCRQVYPEQPWEKRAGELDDRGRGRSAHPEIAWAEYDRLVAARAECVITFR